MKKSLILLLLLPCFLLSGCGKDKETDTVSTISEGTPTLISGYTGLPLPSDSENIKPFLVMVENSKSARPQSGLSYADIVYETSAEGGIPRFMALYQSNMPNKIGPVRSVRPYFIDIANERQLPFAHCGGSGEALETISSNRTIMSINEIANGKYFWRDNKRKAPHNLYTSSNNIQNFINDNNFSYSPTSFLTFSKSFYSNNDLKSANNINIAVNKLYNTSYKYEDGNYIKYMDGEIATEALTNNPLQFKNIVIQKTSITLQQDGTHLDIDLIGKGNGYVISNGKYIDVTWEKSDKSSQTKLYDKDHNLVPLSQGTTIWNIIDNNSNLSIN